MNSPFETLQRDMDGFMRASVLGALAELDVATHLLEAGNSLTAEELAGRTGCSVRGMECLLDALTGMGYLAKQDGRYAVRDDYAGYLDSRSPHTYIPILRHYAAIQRSWDRLSFAVRDGAAQKEGAGESFLGKEEDRVSFIMGMNSVAVRLLPGVMESLHTAGILPLQGKAAILDVGGASGTYTEAFLQCMPEAVATLFDLPPVVELAKKRFDKSPYADRVQYVAGDFHADPLPSGFDFVWVSAIIHQMSREESVQLYKKCFAALKPGGTIVIRDFVMDETRTSPCAGTLFGINMLVNRAGGRVYSFAEIQEDLAKAGFVSAVHAVKVPTMCAIVSAQRPA